jgi:hypothetical protein
MPLKSGRSKEVIQENIREIMHSFKKKKRIGTSKPRSKKEALKQAIAIAYAKARKGALAKQLED